jgi:DNA mismatch endonuclease (patch repair protein)
VADVFSKAKRSEIMSKIHQPTRLERSVHNWLKGMHIRHEMYPKIEGNPDIRLIRPGKDDIYVFVDGDFWHMCPRHYRRPKSNTDFWIRHIEEAERRRMERRRRLGYPWVRIWECEVRSGEYKQIILSLVGRGPHDAGGDGGT